MSKMTAKQLAVWERQRNLNAELLEAIDDARPDRWARKTEFVPLADGRMRRRVPRTDGTIEHKNRARGLGKRWALMRTSFDTAKAPETLGWRRTTPPQFH